MTRTIHKYQLTPGVDQQVTVSRDARVVFVAEQVKDSVTIWIETTPEWVHEQRTYAIIGTGHPIPHTAEHVGSALCDPFVWHVYQLEAHK